MMTLSLKTADVYALGTEPIEILGFKNERELEEALLPLMQDIEQEGFIAA